jgi:membrane-anchored protein YejM (alkaline phosphatase superfamily)
MDWILAELISYLDEFGLAGNTTIAMITDHGEGVHSELRGGLGHGGSTAPELANIPLIIMDPASTGAVCRAVGSQVDVMPTILDYLNLAPPARQPGQGVSLARNEETNRRIYLGSTQDFSVIDGTLFYWFPAGVAADCVAYEITNEGARTIFVERKDLVPDSCDRLAADYARFRTLQDSFIRFYGQYDF